MSRIVNIRLSMHSNAYSTKAFVYYLETAFYALIYSYFKKDSKTTFGNITTDIVAQNLCV